jgi:uncharacterized membrane protein
MSQTTKQDVSAVPSSASVRGHTPPEIRLQIWWWIILIAGVMLRFYRLDFQSLWADEGLQYFVANANSLPDVLDRLAGRSVHPPLSFLINHVFLLLQNSDFFLRLPSALFGIASLPLCYLVARRVTSRPAAVFAMLVLAISPLHIWYSQDGRMYAQLLFLFLLSSVLLFHALERAKWPWWGGYVLSVTAGMYTQVLMALGVMAQLLWVLVCHRRQLLSYCASGVAAVLLCLPLASPWVHFFLHRVSTASTHAGASLGDRPGFSWQALPYTFFVYGAGFSLGPSVAELHAERSLGFLLHFLPSIVAVGVIFVALLGIGFWAVKKQWGTKSLCLCLFGLMVPLGGVMLLSLMTEFTPNVRYTIVALPYFCILVGTALAFLWHKHTPAGLVALLAVLGVSGVSLTNYFFHPRYAKEDVRSAVAFWRSTAQHEYLLSCSTAGGGTRDAINRYLEKPEKDRHVPLGGRRQVVSKINDFFATHGASSAYIILARDWHQLRELAIRNAFSVDHEQSYPGVKIFRIFRE